MVARGSEMRELETCSASTKARFGWCPGFQVNPWVISSYIRGTTRCKVKNHELDSKGSVEPCKGVEPCKVVEQ